MCGSTAHGASYHTPEPATVKTNKKRAVEEAGAAGESMTALQKADALSEQRSDKRVRK